MQYQALAHTDIQVSRIAFGCWSIVGGFNWGPQDERDSIQALQTAYDGGITFFDTAEAYGDGYSEQLLAKALKSQRSSMVIASKALPDHYEPDQLKMACERSLKRLQTDYIDLYQLHWPHPSISLTDTLEVLERLREEGKIRAYGVSNHAEKSLKQAQEGGFQLASNQVAYNLLFRAVEFDLLPAYQAAGIPLLCYSPIMQGLLAGKFTKAEEVPEDRARTRHFASSWPQARHGEAGAEAQTFATIAALKTFAEQHGYHMVHMSLAWLLAQAGVGSVIVGARNAQQAAFNAEAANMKLADADLNVLNTLTDALKTELGPNADLWQGGEDSRLV